MRPLRLHVFLFAALTLAGAPSSVARAVELLQLTPGALSILKPARSVKTVAIGNPDIADATVEGSSTIIVTGKGPGLTSMILLDEAGSEISQVTIQVESKVRKVRILDGGAKTRDYVCDDSCTPLQAPDRVVAPSVTVTPTPADADSPELGQASKVSGQAGTTP